jgi:hypothetical protein
MFNEMKDGEVRTRLDQDHGDVIMRVRQIPGHQLTLAEVESVIDESLRNEKSEALLNALIGRLRKRYPVRLYTDHLMELDLTLI